MIWKILTVILAIVILFLVKCEGGGGTIVKSDTVVRVVTDTVPFAVTDYVPQPYEVKVPVPVYVEGREVIRDVDTGAILRDYYSTRFYSDNQKIKDSSGRQVGEVTINDEISENRIKKRSVFGNVIHDSIYTTITNTMKKRNYLYFGMIAQGNRETIAGGASLMFMQKKGYGIELGALIDTKGTVTGQASLKLKLFK